MCVGVGCVVRVLCVCECEAVHVCGWVCINIRGCEGFSVRMYICM